MRNVYVIASTTEEARDVQLYVETYKCDVTWWSQVALLTTNNSGALTGTDQLCIMSSYGNYWIQPITERRIIKLYAFKTDTGWTDPVVTIKVEDATYSRLDVPSPVWVTDTGSLQKKANTWTGSPEWIVTSRYVWDNYIDTVWLSLYFNPNASGNTWRQLLQSTPA
jgi:hypothetical protein